MPAKLNMFCHPSSVRPLLGAGLVCLLLAALGNPAWGEKPSAFDRAAASAVEADKAVFEPGTETWIKDPAVDTKSYPIYVPTDYTPDRTWPLIVCYHGMNQGPKTWPFKPLTDGKGFIVVGMDYVGSDEDWMSGHWRPTDDAANLKKTMAMVCSKLKVNQKLLFIGGFSKGGFAVVQISDQTIDNWAGIIVLGAGLTPGAPPRAKLAGKPVFLGVGESDPNLQLAKDGAATYRTLGADVTLEIFPGLGHSVDAQNAKLKEWLQIYGPLKEIKAALNDAQALEKAGKLGQAYTVYARLAKDAQAGAIGAAADKSAQAIAAAATQKLADAEAALGRAKYADAFRLLSAAADAYAGSTFGDKAKLRLEQVQADPAIKANIQQIRIDAQADALEAVAAAAEKVKDYAGALQAYQAYVAQFPKATRFAQVKAHFEALQADPAVQQAQAKSQGQAADRECKAWLATADSYIANQQPDKAKIYLQKIIDNYGQSDWADKARQRLAEMPN